MATDIELVQTALVEIDAVSRGLAELASRYKGMVYDVTTPEGMADAVAARKAIHSPIVKVEKIRKEGKAPILDLGHKLDSEAKRITGELEDLKRPIETQINMEKAKQEQAAQVERDRVAGITQAIIDLRMVAGSMGGKSAADIQARMGAIQSYELSEWADEFIVEAEKARAEALAALGQLHAGAVAQEQAVAAEAARITQERAELAKLRADQEERDRRADIAKRQQQEAEEQAAARIVLAERESRERIEAEERVARIAREEADRAARKEREAEEAKLRAERQRIEDEARKVREATEASEREERRKQAELADAKGMLELFAKRYGHIAEFRPLCEWIGKYFAAKKAA